jgi:hypothetical protein
MPYFVHSVVFCWMLDQSYKKHAQWSYSVCFHEHSLILLKYGKSYIRCAFVCMTEPASPKKKTWATFCCPIEYKDMHVEVTWIDIEEAFVVRFIQKLFYVMISLGLVYWKWRHGAMEGSDRTRTMSMYTWYTSKLRHFLYIALQEMTHRSPGQETVAYSLCQVLSQFMRIT